ncbi:MAG: queuosine precursor transporter [Holosporaceae bacterium]|jgi:uncharacterized integral membrane protein (TIGR00697 family)|nr:queuosine precursor transporter [Holosporaceae bacterium]
MPELLSLLTFIVCCFTILGMVKLFGKNGLFAYSAVVVVTANIQVLKLTQYSLTSHPVALGTVLFSTIFVVDNVLTEYYGAQIAKRSVAINFFCYLFFTLIMKITIWHPAVDGGECLNLHMELKNIFSPCLSLFISSLIAYAIGQLVDISIFSLLKRLMKGKRISLRSFISMSISTFLDNGIFSILVWIIFAEHPISLSVLWKTYILAAYIIRLVVAVLCVPLVKLCGFVVSGKPYVQKFWV